MNNTSATYMEINLDNFLYNISKIKELVGDEVIIWVNKNLKLEDLASKCGTINYEILSTISERVPRRFIREEK